MSSSISSSSSSSVHTAVFRLPPAPSTPATIPPKPQVQLRSIPKPSIGSGELLVRIAYAAIQPGDLMWLSGMLKTPKEASEPYAGVSAVGVVEQAGDATLDQYRGKAVMIYRSLDVQLNNVGMWSEYARIVPTQCVIIPPSIFKSSSSLSSLLHYSGTLVNAFTSFAFLHEHLLPSSSSVLITAALSATGRALLAFCARFHIRAIAVVRSTADAEKLRELQKKLVEKPVEGKDWWVLQSDTPTFVTDAGVALAASGATVVFDCVTGALLSSLLPVLLPDTQIFIYSVLDRTPMSVPAALIMQKRLQIRVFSVFRSNTASDSLRLRSALAALSEALEGYGEHLWTNVGRVVEMEKAEEAVKEAAEKYNTKRIVLDFTAKTEKNLQQDAAMQP